MAKQPQTRKTRSKVTDTTTATVKTLDERIADAEARLAKLKQEKLTETLKNDIEKGDEVTFTFGRGESKRDMSGIVAGKADSPIGLIVAVQIEDESGLPDIKRVNVATITSNKTADARRAASGNTPAADPAPAVESSADPLDAE